MNLLYKQFLFSSTKFAEIFVSPKNAETGTVSIRFVNTIKGRKSVSLSVHDVNVIIQAKLEILQYLQSACDEGLMFSLSSSGGGETRLTCSMYNEEPYVHIRYYHYSDTVGEPPKATRFGVSLNTYECIQMYREIDRIVNYITYISKYSNIIYVLFNIISEDFYTLIESIYPSNVSLNLAHAMSNSIDVLMTNQYQSLSSKLNTKMISEKFISHCKKAKIEYTFSSSDLLELISDILKTEIKPFVTSVTKQYTATILKRMLDANSEGINKKDEQRSIKKK